VGVWECDVGMHVTLYCDAGVCDSVAWWRGRTGLVGRWVGKEVGR